MATKTWDGSTDGNFGTAANWAGGVAPVAADDIIVNTGSRAIDTGLASGLDLASFIVGPDYEAELGTSTTNPFTCGITGSFVFNGGGARHYLTAEAAEIAEVRVISVGASGKEHVYLCGGTFDRVVVEAGTLHVEGATINTLVLKSSSGVAADATVEVNSGTITTMYAMVGTVSMPSTSTGTITTLHNSAAATTIAAGTFTNLIQYGGTVDWDVGSATIASAIIYGGTFESKATPDSRTLTYLEVHRNAIADLDNGFANVTITTQKNYGGMISTG